jgi:hypothetical protein
MIDSEIYYPKGEKQMMKLKEAALEIAIGELGKGEEEDNNSGPDIEKYLNGLAEPPSNWCAAFVCWCYQKASGLSEILQHYSINNLYPTTGLLPPFDYTLSARNLFNQFKNEESIGSQFLRTDKQPTPGDLLFFWRGNLGSWMGHVGIIEDVSSRFIHTIEGNKGKFPSKVSRYYYPANPDSISTFLGFGNIGL